MLVLCGFLTVIVPLGFAEVRDISGVMTFRTLMGKVSEDQCTSGKKNQVKFKFEHHFHFPPLDRCKRAIMQSVSKVCRARAAGQ